MIVIALLLCVLFPQNGLRSYFCEEEDGTGPGPVTTCYVMKRFAEGHPVKTLPAVPTEGLETLSKNSPEETPNPKRDSKRTGRYHVYYCL